MINDSNEPSDFSAPAIAAVSEPDAHGFDPAAYQWIPVLRRPRKDGWTQARQIDFIAALADCGVVEQAAAAVSMSVSSCYRLRRAPGAGNFAAAWDAAILQASKRLLDLAFDRAINGSDEPVYDKHGHRIGRRMKTNDRLLMFLLRAYMPDRFAGLRHDPTLLDHEPPLALAPVSEALARLEPVAPEDPALLMPPDALDIAYEIADMFRGEVPHWHQGRPDIEEPVEAPLGPEFEDMLERAKHAAAGVPYIARYKPADEPDERALD